MSCHLVPQVQDIGLCVVLVTVLVVFLSCHFSSDAMKNSMVVVVYPECLIGYLIVADEEYIQHFVPIHLLAHL